MTPGNHPRGDALFLLAIAALLVATLLLAAGVGWR